MDPAIGGALIGAASSLLGGALGSSSSSKAARWNLAYQKQFAQEGIRWRVADAQAAGVHPLYALGANLPAFSPVFSESPMGAALADAGQSVGRALASQETAQERMMRLLSLRKMQSEIHETDLRGMLIQEEINKLRRGGGGQDGIGAPMPQSAVMPEAAVSASPLQGTVNLKPSEVTTHKVGDESTMAGQPPLWREFNMGDGQRIVLPGGAAGDATEVLETLAESPLMAWMVYQENKRRFGEPWADKFIGRYIMGLREGEYDDSWYSKWQRVKKMFSSNEGLDRPWR